MRMDQDEKGNDNDNIRSEHGTHMDSVLPDQMTSVQNSGGCSF